MNPSDDGPMDQETEAYLADAAWYRMQAKHYAQQIDRIKALQRRVINHAKRCESLAAKPYR